MKSLLVLLTLQFTLSQLGQEDPYYPYHNYAPDSKISKQNQELDEDENQQKLIEKVKAQACVQENCKEELIACKFNEQCTDGYNRYLRCYERYSTFIECQGAQLNTREDTREISFQLQNILECYSLCGWADVYSIILQTFLIVILSFTLI